MDGHELLNSNSNRTFMAFRARPVAGRALRRATVRPRTTAMPRWS